MGLFPFLFQWRGAMVPSVVDLATGLPDLFTQPTLDTRTRTGRLR